MKKLLIVHSNLFAGGVESALLSFIENMKDVFDIDLLLFCKAGALYNRLPKDINVLTSGKLLRYFNRVEPENYKKEPSKFNFKSICFKVLRFFGIKSLLKKFATVGQKVKTHYDVVLCAGATNELCLDFTIKCVNADVKIGLIHCDVTKQQHTKSNIKKLSKLDVIGCVSKSVADIFVNKYPEFAGKVDYAYNFQNFEQIKRLSNEFEIKYPKNRFNILSVSRLSGEKGYDRSLKVLKRLKDEGFDFVWHIVGSGVVYSEIENFAKENGMEDNIKLYGLQSNPYPYFVNADLFYLGSYHEAAPIVYFEAMSLGVPVFTTKTSSAVELVGDNGFICENNEEDIYNSLKMILSNKKLCKNKRLMLKDAKIDFTEETKQKFIEWSKKND